MSSIEKRNLSSSDSFQTLDFPFERAPFSRNYVNVDDALCCNNGREAFNPGNCEDLEGSSSLPCVSPARNCRGLDKKREGASNGPSDKLFIVYERVLEKVNASTVIATPRFPPPRFGSLKWAKGTITIRCTAPVPSLRASSISSRLPAVALPIVQTVNNV